MFKYRIRGIGAETIMNRINVYVNDKCIGVSGSSVNGLIIEFSLDLTAGEKQALKDNMYDILKPEIVLLG